jgi:hypothetical protein
MYVAVIVILTVALVELVYVVVILPVAGPRPVRGDGGRAMYIHRLEGPHNFAL